MRTLQPTSLDPSFLPEDYVERRAEARTNILSVALFCVVTLGVIGAFFVTSRQWNDVKRYQQAVNVRYTQAARDIEQLKTLEMQKGDLLEKAEVTTALIEKVPRSILLAEVVNRMPMRMTLLNVEVNSTRLDKPVRSRSAPSRDAEKSTGKSLAGKAAADAKKPEKPPVMAPRFDHRVVLIGVASTHNEVARYVSNLQNCPLLSNTDLIFSETTLIEQQPMNKFRIEADIRPDADARKISPIQTPRLQSVQSIQGTPHDPAATPPAPELEDWKWNPEAPRPDPAPPASSEPTGGN